MTPDSRRDSTSPWPTGDSLVIAQLEACGSEVTILDDDLVVISSTLQSNALRADEGRGYRVLEVPFINWENGLTAKGSPGLLTNRK